MQQLYVAELSDNGIEVLHEVSQEELDELRHHIQISRHFIE